MDNYDHPRASRLTDHTDGAGAAAMTYPEEKSDARCAEQEKHPGEVADVAAKEPESDLPSGGAGLADIRRVLRDHPRWRDVLAFNRFTAETEITAPLPGVDEDPEGFPRASTDLDVMRARLWLQESDLVRKPSRQDVREALDLVAHDNGYDPVIDYLDGLAWDGEKRLGRWLTTYCAVGDSPYVRAVGRAWMVAAVARQYRPGCKVDSMLILEGAQGIGKSSALSILGVRENWFGDHLPNLGTKDAHQYLSGRWIVEMSELAAFERSRGEELKAFLTRQIDKYRPPYGSKVIEQPRRCVFAGTTNESEYLNDTSGNRRYWPVRCEGVFDLVALRRDRDQLWSEAVSAFKGGESWTLPVSLQADAATEQRARVVSDPLEVPVRTWLDETGRSEVSIPELLDRAPALSTLARSRETSRRLGAILRRLGWSQAGTVKTRGPYRDQRRWLRTAE